ncbi:hypothetical protein EHP00_962 [Ecytonucleospora hepatopenaei]|uniref:Uncharacterized protein n=1 Tax=Ecytonucleospora hepatopenaei TaxID=646526 RepID=A0A1W0E6Q3_9MICR|nr:hypothetical protein EHP00_962 [Ecytonucleospora hepatopenaei]
MLFIYLLGIFTAIGGFTNDNLFNKTLYLQNKTDKHLKILRKLIDRYDGYFSYNTNVSNGNIYNSNIQNIIKKSLKIIKEIDQFISYLNQLNNSNNDHFYYINQLTGKKDDITKLLKKLNDK